MGAEEIRIPSGRMSRCPSRGQTMSSPAARERRMICPSGSAMQAASVDASNSSAYPVLDGIIRQRMQLS